MLGYILKIDELRNSGSNGPLFIQASRIEINLKRCNLIYNDKFLFLAV